MKFLGAALLFLSAAFLSAMGVMFLLYAANFGGWNQNPTNSLNYIISGIFMLMLSIIFAYYSHKLFSKAKQFSEEMLQEIAKVFKEQNGFMPASKIQQIAIKIAGKKQSNRYFFLLKKSGDLFAFKRKSTKETSDIPKKTQEQLAKFLPNETFFYIPHYQKKKPNACPFCSASLTFDISKDPSAKEKICNHCLSDLSFLVNK